MGVSEGEGARSVLFCLGGFHIQTVKCSRALREVSAGDHSELGSSARREHAEVDDREVGVGCIDVHVQDFSAHRFLFRSHTVD